MGKVLVLSGFPGVGKSYFTSRRPNYSKQILDSDSSLFSWKYLDNAQRIRNENFPENYLNYIGFWYKVLQDYPVMEELPLQKAGISGVIFTSTHQDVLAGLAEINIPHQIVLPNSKEEVMAKYKQRNDNAGFIETLNKNYDKFIEDCLKHAHETCTKIIRTSSIEEAFNQGKFL